MREHATQAIVGLFPRAASGRSSTRSWSTAYEALSQVTATGGKEPYTITVDPQHAHRARILIGGLRKRGRA